MAAAQFLKTRVTEDVKQRVHALAEQALITESVWLKRLVATALREVPNDESAMARVRLAGQERPSRGRVCIRLRPSDRLLLKKQAALQGMAAATYISVLVRAHLNSVAPLPKDELVALKQSVAELGAIGRNLNQIARVANSSGAVTGPTREDLRAMLKVCEALRDNVKRVIKANVNAWEIGHAEDH